MREEQCLIEILRYLLNSENSENDLQIPAKCLDWLKILEIAQKHGVSSMLCYALTKFPEELQPEESLKERMCYLAMRAVGIDITQKQEIEKIEQAFEENKLYCMPVKGSCTKMYYPKSEWRTMGDLDVLYKEEQHKEVKALLLDLGYGNFESGLKHDHYSKMPLITLEMHRRLVAANTIAYEYYQDIWERVICDKKYVCRMTLEDQYIYTMIHLLEHFIEGGVGIRFIMDIYVFLQKEGLNHTYIRSEFQKIGIDRFAENIEMLAMVWFSYNNVTQSTAIVDEMGTFIMKNGIYGTSEQAQALALEKDGYIGYVKRVVFPDLSTMQTLYTWLKQAPYLLPIAWCVRIMRTVLYRKKKIKSGLNTMKQGSIEKGKKLKEFYKRCGIND